LGLHFDVGGAECLVGWWVGGFFGGSAAALKELNKLLTLYLIKVLLVRCFSHLFADAVVLSVGQLGQLSAALESAVRL